MVRWPFMASRATRALNSALCWRRCVDMFLSFYGWIMIDSSPKIRTTWKVRSGQFPNSPSRRNQTVKKSFTNEQIIATLRLVETGTSVADACRKIGITEQTFYRWKRKFAGLGVAELHRLRQLEDENKRLKSLVADLTLDKHMLQEVIAKKL